MERKQDLDPGSIEVEERAQASIAELTTANEQLRLELEGFRRAESALRRSETRLARLLEITPNAIIAIDQSQRITLFNRSAEELFGYTAEEAIDQPLDILIPARFAEAHRGHIGGFAASPTVARRMNERGAVFGLRKDGTEFPAEAAISKLEDQDGPVFIVVIQDISERKESEEALLRYTHALERSNQELERFAYIASHDLQEPLRMVSSYLGLLARRYKGKLDQDADEFIQYAVDGARRMKEMIDDLLAYSRVEARSGDFLPTDLNRVVQDTLNNLEIAIQETGAQITVERLPTLMADRSQLVQVFQNLIGNAIKFRDLAPPRIHISAQRRGREWAFAVEDNGIGIAPEHQERVFLMFQRLHPPGRYPGSGAGLSIAQRIVERHGGRIWVESQPGVGSTFHFTIPEAGGNR